MSKNLIAVSLISTPDSNMLTDCFKIALSTVSCRNDSERKGSTFVTEDGNIRLEDDTWDEVSIDEPEATASELL